MFPTNSRTSMPITSDNPIYQNMSSCSSLKRGSPLARFLHYTVQQNPLIKEWPKADTAIIANSVIEHLICGSTREQITFYLDSIVTSAGLGPEPSETRKFSEWLFDTMNCWMDEKEKAWSSNNSQATGESNAVVSSSNILSNVKNPLARLSQRKQRRAQSPTPDLKARSATIATPSSIDNIFTDMIDVDDRLIATYGWIKSPLNQIKTSLTSAKYATRKYIRDADEAKIKAQRLSLEASTSLKQEEIKNKKLNKRLEELESQLDEKEREIAERNAKVTTLQNEIHDLGVTVKKVMGTADEFYAWKVQAIENRCKEIDEAKKELEKAIEKAVEHGFVYRPMQELPRSVVPTEHFVDDSHDTGSEDHPQRDNHILSCSFEEFGTSETVSEEDDSPDDGEIRSVTMPHGGQEDVWYDETDNIWRNDLGVSGHIGPNMTFVPSSLLTPEPEPESSVHSQLEMNDYAETDDTVEDSEEHTESPAEFYPFEYHKCPNGYIFVRWDEEQQVWETDQGDRGHFDEEGNFNVFCEDSNSEFRCDNSSEIEDEDGELSGYESDEAEEWESDEEDFPEENLDISVDRGHCSHCQPKQSSEAEDEELPDDENLSSQGDEFPGHDQELPASSLPSVTPQVSDVPQPKNDINVNLVPIAPQLDNGLKGMDSSLKRSADHDNIELPEAKRQRPNKNQPRNIFLANAEAMMQVDTQQETEVESSNGDDSEEEEDDQEMITYLAYLQRRIRFYVAQYAESSTKCLAFYKSQPTLYENNIKYLKQVTGERLTQCFHKMISILTHNIRNNKHHFISNLRANLYTLACEDVHEDAYQLASNMTKDNVAREVLQECAKLFYAVLKGVGRGSSMEAHVQIADTEGFEAAKVVVL